MSRQMCGEASQDEARVDCHILSREESGQDTEQKGAGPKAEPGVARVTRAGVAHPKGIEDLHGRVPEENGRPQSLVRPLADGS